MSRGRTRRARSRDFLSFQFTPFVPSTADIHGRHPWQTSTADIHRRHPPQTSAADIHRRHPRQTSTADIHRRHPPQTSTADIHRCHPRQTSTADIHRRHSPQTSTADIHRRHPPQTSTADIHGRHPPQTTRFYIRSNDGRQPVTLRVKRRQNCEESTRVFDRTHDNRGYKAAGFRSSSCDVDPPSTGNPPPANWKQTAVRRRQSEHVLTVRPVSRSVRPPVRPDPPVRRPDPPARRPAGPTRPSGWTRSFGTDLRPFCESTR